jgi:hypothetical protein
VFGIILYKTGNWRKKESGNRRVDASFKSVVVWVAVALSLLHVTLLIDYQASCSIKGRREKQEREERKRNKRLKVCSGENERERECVCVCEREREARRGKGGVEVRRFEGF